MSPAFNKFIKTKKFLLCVDSDGCAMDTMEIKHRKCFAPEMIKTWELFQDEDIITKMWLKINLYSATRGINRFKGLVKTFQLMKENGVSTPEFEGIASWAESARELSNQALEDAGENGDNSLKKALEWSEAVNSSITVLPDTAKPFDNVKNVLEQASRVADIAVVSSANLSAVEEEWKRHGIMKHTDILLGQEHGSKGHCIAQLKKTGYSDAHVLMVGDAPGDLQAAQENNILFYPILAGSESKSWEVLYTQGINRFLSEDFSRLYQQQLIESFEQNLNY